MFLGEVETLGTESIQTRFFVLGVPLVPMSSHYVVGASFNSIRGFEIPLHGKSIGLGYLRVTSWCAALVCGVFYGFEPHAWASLLPWAIVATVVALIATFALGRLSSRERTRRTLLSMATGLGAPPELLPADAREQTTAKLEAEWHQTGQGRPWDKAIEAGDADPTLYALAEYADRPDLARLVLDNFSRTGELPGQPYR